MPATPKVAHISPRGRFSKKPERTENTHMRMLIAQRLRERSHRDGTMRMGIPIAMMRPCFQSIVLRSS